MNMSNIPKSTDTRSNHVNSEVDSSFSAGSVSSKNALSKEKNDDDLVFWTRIKEGDIDALGCLYDSYIDVLFPYGLSLVSDKVLVMDSIHDLFLDLFKYRNKLAANPQVKFYLLRSLKRKVFKKGKMLGADFESMNDSRLLHLHMCELSAEKKFIEIENDVDRKRQVDLALECLTKKQKRAVKLKFYEGRSYEEIAALMDVTIETARTLIYRSVSSLRKKMAGISFLLSWLLV